MLRFYVFDHDALPASTWPLRNAYIVGADGNAMRCDITFRNGIIDVHKRDAGAAALALQHPAGDLGELTLQTCLLPDREEPYILTLELARHRLMTLYAKLEDWQMFELPEDHPVTKRSETARKKFIEALCRAGDSPEEAARLAGESLHTALDGSEELALAHSELLLNRRIFVGALPKAPLGCGAALELRDERVRAGLRSQFDFVQVPMPWKALCPEEGNYQWGLMDDWVEWSAAQRVPLVAGPLIAFEPGELPDWLYIWEHDYDTVRDMIYEHVERVVERYKNTVTAWNVVSGLHVNKHFTFNFEQLMDLTRMCTMLVKKAQPASKAIVELRQPFGEYYGENQRSIPPLMYADLLVQSSIGFDALSIRYPMGQAMPGQHTRDLMQLSNMLDQFSHFGKPVHVTLGVPSETVTSMMIARAESNDPVDAEAGYWRRPWSGVVQSHWLEAALQIAVSKPYIDAVAWHDLVDHPNIELPLSGLVGEDLQARPAWRRLVGFRRHLLGQPPEGAGEADAANVGGGGAGGAGAAGGVGAG
ncbi:MAG: endo-1,4-beta-xylanase [Planctomycetota bacterium]